MMTVEYCHCNCSENTVNTGAILQQSKFIVCLVYLFANIDCHGPKTGFDCIKKITFRLLSLFGSEVLSMLTNE